jgi:hypothetical protein
VVYADGDFSLRRRKFHKEEQDIFIEGGNSSDGTATRYWMEDPGIESRRGKYSPHRSKQALVRT